MSSSARFLAGRTVVITRPERQATGLAHLIEHAGGHVLRFPVMEIEPAGNAALDSIIDNLDSFDLAIFISRNAVEQGVARVRRRRAWPPHLAIAAVGAGTRRALEAQGIANAFSPAGPADSEALLAHARLLAVAGQRIVIFRGQGGRELLAATLRARGASVEYAECYLRRIPASDPQPLIAALSGGAVDAIVIASGETLANLIGLLGEAARGLLTAAPLFVPHLRVAADARAFGIADCVVAGPGDDEMLGALVAYFHRAG
ncbi:MAG: uroporphyrinogen-III synthase [Betaproteobacteria bacterium]|nr:uroporphyrinogen-III synthase [Betaproteobacteria bacterium]